MRVDARGPAAARILSLPRDSRETPAPRQQYVQYSRPQPDSTYGWAAAPQEATPPVYAQPAYVQPVYLQPRPPPVQCVPVPVYQEPEYVPVRPVIAEAAPFLYPAYRCGWWGCG